MTKLEEQLTAENVRLREALILIASYDTNNTGCCAYGCDTPSIASNALQNSTPQVEALQALIEAAIGLKNITSSATAQEVVNAVLKYQETL